MAADCGRQRRAGFDFIAEKVERPVGQGIEFRIAANRVVRISCQLDQETSCSRNDGGAGRFGMVLPTGRSAEIEPIFVVGGFLAFTVDEEIVCDGQPLLRITCSM